jgi:hypothetical protein
MHTTNNHCLLFESSLLYNKLDCVLGSLELIDTIDALCLTFQIILDNPFYSCKPLANARRNCKVR